MATLHQQLHHSATHAKGNDPACPVCQRHSAVNELIAEVGARHLSDVRGPDGGSLSFYVLPNGHTFIVQWYKEDSGFEMYGPLSTINRVQDAFMALSQLAAEPAA